MHKAMVTAVALLLLAGLSWAQKPGKTTVVLTELHCMGCAKRIATELYKIEGVGEVRVDLDARTLFITHKTGTTPSPKKMWEAIEETEHVPERMETPSGKHVSKPKN